MAQSFFRRSWEVNCVCVFLDVCAPHVEERRGAVDLNLEAVPVTRYCPTFEFANDLFLFARRIADIFQYENLQCEKKMR